VAVALQGPRLSRAGVRAAKEWVRLGPPRVRGLGPGGEPNARAV